MALTTLFGGVLHCIHMSDQTAHTCRP